MNPHLADKVERAAATFTQAFLSVFVISDLSTARTALVAAGAAMLALVKAWARGFG
jgi:hypothetical protein